MLGADDLMVIFVATTLANLVVEIGAEVVAEWVVNGGSGAGAEAAASAEPAAVGNGVTWMLAQGTDIAVASAASISQYATALGGWAF